MDYRLTATEAAPQIAAGSLEPADLMEACLDRTAMRELAIHTADGEVEYRVAFNGLLRLPTRVSFQMERLGEQGRRNWNELHNVSVARFELSQMKTPHEATYVIAFPASAVPAQLFTRAPFSPGRVSGLMGREACIPARRTVASRSGSISAQRAARPFCGRATSMPANMASPLGVLPTLHFLRP
jgi:hypothetical protein